MKNSDDKERRAEQNRKKKSMQQQERQKKNKKKNDARRTKEETPATQETSRSPETRKRKDIPLTCRVKQDKTPPNSPQTCLNNSYLQETNLEVLKQIISHLLTKEPYYGEKKNKIPHGSISKKRPNKQHKPESLIHEEEYSYSDQDSDFTSSSAQDQEPPPPPLTPIVPDPCQSYGEDPEEEVNPLLMSSDPNDYLADGSTVLINAIKSNNEKEVKRLLLNSCDINMPDKRSNHAPILWAMMQNHTEIASLLIKAKCNLNVSDQYDKLCTPLHHCLEKKCLHSLLDLFKDDDVKLNVNTRSKRGRYPLQIATKNSDIKYIRRLLEMGADRNAKSKGQYALHIACERGIPEVVHLLLLNAKIDVNCTDRDRNTPLHKAVQQNSEKIVTYLLEHQAHPLLKNKWDLYPKDLIKYTTHQGLRIFKQLEDYNPGCKYWKGQIDLADLKTERMIGSGRFGTVYLGELHGTICAVKVVKPSNECSFEQMKYEIGLMSDIHHPNIVAFLGAYVKEDSKPEIKILTEFMDGGCLRDYINNCKEKHPLRRGPLDWQQLLSMGLDIARGMAWLHSRHPPILHRDLHAKNILVTTNGVCKVCDFGLSYIQGGFYKTYIIYDRIIPPEIRAKQQDYSKEADVFMFGLVLYELLTGEKAEPENTKPEIFDVLHKDVAFPQASKFLVMLCECIKPDPKNRPTFENIIVQLNEFSPHIQSEDGHPLLPVTSIYVDIK